MNLPPSDRLFTTRLLLAASLASTIGGLPFNALPVLLGSLADAFGLPPQTVGMVGSVCFAGYLVGTLGAPWWLDRVNARVLTVVSALALAAAYGLSAAVSEASLLFPAWALIGFFASTMTCLGMRILAAWPDPVRALGVRQGVELSFTAAVLFALPPLFVARWGYAGAAVALAATVVLLSLSALALPDRAAARAGSDGVVAADVTAGGGRPPRMSPSAFVAMAIFFVFLTGHIGLWAFLERIGAGLKVPAAEMGLVFAVLKLLGGAAAFFVAWVGGRGGWSLPHTVVLGGVALGLGLLWQAQGFVAFALGAWIWEFAFTCGCVLQAASIARCDASGRAIVLVPAVFALSSMVGPALAGHIAAAGDFAPVLALAGAVSVAAALAYRVWRPALPA